MNKYCIAVELQMLITNFENTNIQVINHFNLGCDTVCHDYGMFQLNIPINKWVCVLKMVILMISPCVLCLFRYESPEIALNCGIMLRECIRHEPLAKITLWSEQFYDFFRYVEMSTFDIASDAFATFKVSWLICSVLQTFLLSLWNICDCSKPVPVISKEPISIFSNVTHWHTVIRDYQRCYLQFHSSLQLPHFRLPATLLMVVCLHYIIWNIVTN